jgi:hypothetical protein
MRELFPKYTSRIGYVVINTDYALLISYTSSYDVCKADFCHQESKAGAREPVHKRYVKNGRVMRLTTETSDKANVRHAVALRWRERLLIHNR